MKTNSPVWPKVVGIPKSFPVQEDTGSFIGNERGPESFPGQEDTGSFIGNEPADFLEKEKVAFIPNSPFMFVILIS